MSSHLPKEIPPFAFSSCSPAMATADTGRLSQHMGVCCLSNKRSSFNINSFIWKAKLHREIALLSADSLSEKAANTQDMVRLKARSLNSMDVFHVGGSGPSTRASEQRAGSKWDSQDLNQRSYGMPVLQLHSQHHNNSSSNSFKGLTLFSLTIMQLSKEEKNEKYNSG